MFDGSAHIVQTSRLTRCSNIMLIVCLPVIVLICTLGLIVLIAVAAQIIPMFFRISDNFQVIANSIDSSAHTFQSWDMNSVFNTVENANRLVNMLHTYVPLLDKLTELDKLSNLDELSNLSKLSNLVYLEQTTQFSTKLNELIEQFRVLNENVHTILDKLH